MQHDKLVVLITDDDQDDILMIREEIEKKAIVNVVSK
jgi:hypothetical protein